MSGCVLFDVDLFSKLACCDLWQDVLGIFDITDPRRLPSAVARSCMKKMERQMPGASRSVLGTIQARVAQMVQETPRISDVWAEKAIISSLYSQLIGVPSIDSGEALLASIALAVPEARESRLATGDKRFIKALEEHFPQQFALLEPRLISLEDCMIRMIRKDGIARIRNLTAVCLDSDQSLRVAFGGDMNKSAEKVIEILSIYNPVKHAW